MAVKYFFEHYDIHNNLYRVELSNPDYVGSEIEIEGSVSLHKNQNERASYPINSMSAAIELQASTERNLSDLGTDEERYWSVVVKLNGNDKFFGYLTSDNGYQPFQADRWSITVIALDPLAFMSDLKFVDYVGALYTGQETLILILAKALSRGFVDSSDEFEILTYCPLGYQPLESTLVDNGKFLEDVTVLQDIWTDETSGGVQDCQTVVFDILDSLGLAIKQIEGNTWIIYDPLVDMTLIDLKYIRRYNSSGVWISNDVVNKFSKVILLGGHDTDTNDHIHIEENQQYSYKRTVSSVGVDFTHNLAPQFLENPNMLNGVSPRTMPNWIFLQDLDGNYQSYATVNGYVVLEGVLPSEPNKQVITLESEKRYVQEGESLSLVANIDYQGASEDDLFGHYIQVKLVGTSNTWYLDGAENRSPQWTTFESNYYIRQFDLIDLSVEMPTIPEDGQLGIGLFPVYYMTINGTPTILPTRVWYIDLIPTAGAATGNTYTGTLTGNKSGAATKESISIATAISYSIQNAFYFGAAPIENVYHAYLAKTVELGEIAVNKYLMEGARRILFTGSVLNPLSELNYISIPELSTNLFRILSYSFIGSENIGYYEFIEVNESVPAYDYEKGSIYPDTIKPTIVG